MPILKQYCLPILEEHSKPISTEYYLSILDQYSKPMSAQCWMPIFDCRLMATNIGPILAESRTSILGQRKTLLHSNIGTILVANIGSRWPIVAQYWAIGKFPNGLVDNWKYFITKLSKKIIKMNHFLKICEFLRHKFDEN